MNLASLVFIIPAYYLYPDGITVSKASTYGRILHYMLWRDSIGKSNSPKSQIIPHSDNGSDKYMYEGSSYHFSLPFSLCMYAGSS